MIRHMYVHVPFCLRRCSYCDFAVQAVSSAPTGSWLQAISAELALVRGEQGWEEPHALRTLYVGGGTPSLIGTSGMSELARVLHEHAAWDESVEWTAEANPETFTPELAADWARTGVNRVSLGVQSFDENVLRWMGRLHGAQGSARATAAARAAGISNVSVDLIFALPSRLNRNWARDLEAALALAPEHLSLYGLTAEPATPLGRWVTEGREQLADEDEYAEEYLFAAERLTAAGYEHYEVSNFALPGYESRHNRAYWHGVPYLGLGPGAHSFLPPVRRWNVRDWHLYQSRLRDGQPALDGSEQVAAGRASLEKAWLGLRTREGISRTSCTPGQLQVIRRWQEAGWADLAGDRVRLTAAGWLLLDRLTVELDAA